MGEILRVVHWHVRKDTKCVLHVPIHSEHAEMVNAGFVESPYQGVMTTILRPILLCKLRKIISLPSNLTPHLQHHSLHLNGLSMYIRMEILHVCTTIIITQT